MPKLPSALPSLEITPNLQRMEVPKQMAPQMLLSQQRFSGNVSFPSQSRFHLFCAQNLGCRVFLLFFFFLSQFVLGRESFSWTFCIGFFFFLSFRALIFPSFGLHLFSNPQNLLTFTPKPPKLLKSPYKPGL